MKSLKFIIALLLPIAFIACGKFSKVDFCFPRTVEFSKEGGEKVVKSEEGMHFTHAEIHNYESGENGTPTTLEDGTSCNTYKWLKIEYQNNSNELKIIAEPNSSSSRKLHIELYSGYDYQVIEVFQEAAMMLE